MKKNYLALVLFILAQIGYNRASAQMVGANCFLQGAFVEIGVCANGSFGPNGAAPAGYHAFPVGGSLAEVYDQGHDGWAVGVPAMRGDYTYPGTPFEGWEIQLAGGRAQPYQAYTPGYNCTAGVTMTGAGLTTYSNAGGIITGNWAGTVTNGAASLDLQMETRVDTLGSAVIMTMKMYNHTTSPVPGVYYMRTCDPDNDEAHGGSFATNNTIIHQNEDLTHRVQVQAKGTLYPADPTTMDLCTKDCRAVCMIYDSWYFANSVDLAQVWAGTAAGIGGTQYLLNGTRNGDIAIGLVFNIGTIAPGDSTSVSCSYVFNGAFGVDSAFPDPALSVNGTIYTEPTAPPSVIIDTYNACLNPGLTAVPVDIIHGDDKCWTFSRWTWTPATGLASTTGVHNTVITTALPPVITYTITGTDSATCNYRTMLLTFITCNNTRNNSPCYGDSLLLQRIGDSTGCTYFWYGPSGFTSTRQNPFRFPATYADSGMYYVVRTLLGVHDTDSTHVVIHYKPDVIATNNAPLCAGMVDTLLLFCNPAIPGETFSWTGPAAFTATTQNTTRPGYIAADTGIYRVIVETTFGCKDTAYTDAGMIPQPLPPIVSGRQRYCTGEPFEPFTVSGLVPGSRIRWYLNNTVAMGDTLAVAPVVITAIPGVTTVYFSQRSGNCESHRDSFKVRVYTTPAAPVVAGPMQYCQFIGPIVPLTIVPATTDTISWYMVATGGSPFYTEPLPSINIAGSNDYWVSHTDSGCESPRTPVNITIHPKPAPPIITPTPWCQFRTPGQVIANPSGTGDVLTWYGPGVTPGSSVAPTPGTSVAPDSIDYYVTETTMYGCISDSALDKVVIKVKPPVPATRDIAYCQHDIAQPLNLLVDSIGNSHLNWYYNTVGLNPTPTPFTDTVPGIYTWYVSQTVPNDATGCEGDSAAVNVTIIYKPVFDIHVSAPYVCQFDSLTLSYCCGPSLYAPGYHWTLPDGARAVANTGVFDSVIMVAFDNSNMNNYVVLTASDDSGFCSTNDTVRINVVKQPDMTSFSKPDVCLGDTVMMALDARSSGAYNFTWFIDDVPMDASTAIRIVTSNSNSGGPYYISWVDSGMHVIKVVSRSVEGCVSMPAYDSINVHNAPDATFHIAGIDSGAQFCLEDSVLFKANLDNYKYSYAWLPEHSFHNINAGTIYGKMESLQSKVTLTVTDPYGCHATSSQIIEPGTCCSVLFPNAFTPNGDGRNNVFRPIFSGFHRFHVFRIVNRWGITMFEGGNSDVKWDGTYNGVPQDMGTYFYYLKYDCGGKTLEVKGDVTLIR